MKITSFSQLDISKQYSYADYLAWQIQERLEIIKGWVTQMATPSALHQTISQRINFVLYKHFEEHPCNVYTAPFDVRLTRKGTDNKLVSTVVQPDLCVICDLDKIDKRGCVGAPDLIVEILSPGNTRKEMKEKFEIYEENGVKEYWIVQPTDKYIAVFVLNEQGKYISFKPFVEDEIFISPTFPALNFDVSPIFKKIK